MKKKITAAFAALTAIAGLSSSVQARPAVANPEAREFALNQESVVGVENRTIGDDYKKFFGVQNSANIALRDVTEDNYFLGDGDDGVWRIDEDLKLLVNEPLSPPVGVVPFSRDGEGASLFGDVNRIELQTELN